MKITHPVEFSVAQKKCCKKKILVYFWTSNNLSCLFADTLTHYLDKLPTFNRKSYHDIVYMVNI